MYTDTVRGTGNTHIQLNPTQPNQALHCTVIVRYGTA